MIVTFRCGHRRIVLASQAGQPECPDCHEARIVSVHEATPRFVGTASGPHVQTQDLPAIAVQLGTEPDHAA